jgi:hypothetical protein
MPDKEREVNMKITANERVMTQWAFSMMLMFIFMVVDGRFWHSVFLEIMFASMSATGVLIVMSREDFGRKLNRVTVVYKE